MQVLLAQTFKYKFRHTKQCNIFVTVNNITINLKRLEKMKLNIYTVLVIFVVFASLSCIAAADVNANSEGPAIVLDESNNFVMSVPYNAGTGYHWEVSPETHGVSFESVNYEVDHPGLCGSSGTAYFNFHVEDSDYYVKLVLISPAGDIVDEVDSNMIN